MIIRGLGRLLCCRDLSCFHERYDVSDYVDVRNWLSSHTSPENHTELASHGIDADVESRYENGTCQTLCSDVREILAAIREFNTRQRELLATHERDKAIVREWIVLASVLDRVFFWIYLVAIILGTAFLFPWV